MSRRNVLLLLAAAACTFEVPIEEPDRSPVPTILTPSQSSQLLAGEVVLRGIVSDPQDPTENVFVVWALGDERSDAEGTWVEACAALAQADGSTICGARLDESHTRIRLTATDPAGFRGVDEVAVNVIPANPPIVELIDPRQGVPYFANVPVPLLARVQDADHEPEALSLRWGLEGGGTITGPLLLDGAGEARGEVLLGAGEHTVVLTVTDPGGSIGEDRLTVSVGGPDLAPICRIDEPADGHVMELETMLTLDGSVLDEVSSPEALTVSWSSDRDGVLDELIPSALGRVTSEIAGLTLGAHVLSLEATDEHGGTCVVTRQIVVDTAPSVSFVAPGPDQTVALGETLVVEAFARDDVSPAEELRVSLTSDRDGPRWTRTPDEAGMVSAGVILSAGTHVLTLSVVDAGGLSGEDQVVVEVGL
jgi:hypothetical protein